MGNKVKAQEFANETYKIHVTGRNVLITEAMKQYALLKVQKINRLSERIVDVKITMDIQKLDHLVDIIMKVENIKIKSSGLSTDMYASIDQAVDKLENQLKRYRSRIVDHHGKHLSTIDMEVDVFRRPLDEGSIELEEVYNGVSPHVIEKQKTIPLKRLTLQEAMWEMDLSNHAFLLFKNEEDKDLSLHVIYRRKDGNYGVIKPK
jgi:putative sigma-54 modulation protein